MTLSRNTPEVIQCKSSLVKAPDIDLTGCTRTVIHLGKKSAWIGASSRIAEGGGRWSKDPKATVPIWKRVARAEFTKAEASGLECRENAEGECFIRAYAPLYRYHPDLKNPWKAIAPREFEYIRVPSANGGGAELTAINKLDNMGHLAAFGVEIPKGASTFACGLLKASLDRRILRLKLPLWAGFKR